MKTAVEWLFENLDLSGGSEAIEAFQQAKEMEKQQMCEFAVDFMMQYRPVVSYWESKFKSE